MEMNSRKLEKMAGEEMEAVFSAIPAPLRKRAREPAVVLLARPADCRDCAGIEEDTMGLFVGNPFAEGVDPDGSVSPRIYLFLENIWAEADCDPALFRAELRDTLLHELGHYLGLEEENLAERGIE